MTVEYRGSESKYSYVWRRIYLTAFTTGMKNRISRFYSRRPARYTALISFHKTDANATMNVLNAPVPRRSKHEYDAVSVCWVIENILCGQCTAKHRQRQQMTT